MTSEPCLLVADGGPICLSASSGWARRGHPHRGDRRGRYVVRSTLVAWDDEPGVRAEDGSPGPDALGDFVVTITAAGGTEVFRTDEATFDPPV